MKVITNKVGGLAINPQTVLYFNQGDVFEAGTKQLTETNIARLIELGFADIAEDVIEEFSEKSEETAVETMPEKLPEESIDSEVASEEISDSDDSLFDENSVEDEVKAPDAYDFESITRKDELSEYAKEIYNIELDSSQSLKKMITALKTEIEKEGE